MVDSEPNEGQCAEIASAVTLLVACVVSFLAVAAGLVMSLVGGLVWWWMK